MAELSTIPGLKGRIAATERRLKRLAIARAFWPLLVFVALFLGLALIGAFEYLPTIPGSAVALGALIAAALLFLRGLRRYASPVPGEAARALDAQSDLRPISSIEDRPSRPTKPAQALWEAHTATLAKAARALKPPSFAKAWNALDPYRVRYLLPLLLIGAVSLAGIDAPGRIARALSPDIGALAGADQIRIEAWITPPAYSGRAPIFVGPDLTEARVPAGSTITLRAQARSAPTLVLKADKRTRTPFEATPDGAFEARATINGDTTVAVHWWGERRALRLLASPDAPPEAAFAAVPTLTTKDRTEFSWAARDDYGVETLELAFQLTEPNPAAPNAETRVPVAMPGISPKEAEDTTELDLTRHRWAGLSVTARLVATDGAGQEGFSDPHVFVLPEKLFLQPLAKAAQEARVTVLREPREYEAIGENMAAVTSGAINTAPMNRLDQAPDDVHRAALMLDALTYEAPRYFRDYALYLGLRNAHALLETATSKEDADSVDPILWAVALKAEYGSSADALAALMAAKKALEQALRDGAPEETIKRLMEAFKEAAENYVAAKMAEALANGLDAAPNDTDGEAGEGPSLGGQDFSDMLQALEDLTETGATEQARQLLSDITNMLENLEFQQGGSGEGGFPGMPGSGGEGEDSEGSQEEQALSDTLERLSDLLREQRELNDDTLAQGRGETPSGESGEDPGDQGRLGDDGSGAPGERDGQGAGGLADRQDELGEAVENFAEGEGTEGEAGTGALNDDMLGEIRNAQRRAADALRRGNQRLAERNQERATRLLRDLSGDIAEQLDELRDARDGEGESETDPFGRPVGGANDSDSVTVPDEAERQRAKDILEELRRRYGDAEEDDEKDYLDRLLDRF